MYGTLIQTVTVGAGGAASIDFTSIPGTYTDLVLVASLREATGTQWTSNILFNGVATNQSERYLRGNGASAISNSQSVIQTIDNGSDATSNTFNNQIVYIPNYAGSTNKSVSSESVGETNATTAYSRISASLWSSTAAITSITIKVSNSTNFAQYSTASLYGVLKGSGGATAA